MRSKNTSREATVAKHIDEFLKGRTPKAREEFLSRSLDRQYSSIIQWRRAKRIKERTPQSTEEILETISRLAEMIANAPEISESDSRDISERIGALQGKLTDYMEAQKLRSIQALEEESRRINARLSELRGF